MMDMEILEDFSEANDQTIVKGKRTKRLRPSSSASSSGGGCVGGGGEFRGHSLVSSPTTSSGVSTTTEEDEDMANCLILLAQGGGGFSSQSEEEIKEVENKFSSRKFTEMATTTAGKVGIYVYECKTCSRAFPSFQALGGHRASHKKPKPSTDIDQKNSPPAPPDDQQHEVEEGESSKHHTAPPPPPPPPPPSTQSPNKNFHVDHQINKPKIHECSICGSEFASGQALGGHMRRHRPAVMATNSTTTTTRSANDSSSNDVGEKTRNVLALDLNLPAPPEDERRDANFHQFSSNQQPRLAFSAAAPLVDCHY